MSAILTIELEASTLTISIRKTIKNNQSRASHNQ
jgi:hypothetical protein